MKRAMRMFSLLIIPLLLTGLLTAGNSYAYDSIITGQDNPELDVKAVQDAVDKGGSVLLKGMFDFGQKGQVNIKKNVEISGESDSNSNPITKIKRGFWTFHSPLPTTELPLPMPGPTIKIKNIHFDGAIWTPMHFPYISGAEISGNKTLYSIVSPFKSFTWSF